MRRSTFWFLLPMAIPAAWVADRAAAADDGSALFGAWLGQSGAGGLQETWTIARENGQWSVAGTFTKDGQEVGSFRSQDAKFAQGALSFRQEYVKKPQASWTDGNRITAAAKGDTLDITWHSGRQTGRVTLHRAAAATGDPAIAKRNPKSTPKGAKGSGETQTTTSPGSGQPLAPETRAELNKLAGTWNFKDFMLDGRTIDFGATWQFKGDTIAESIGLPRRSGTVSIDPAKEPKTMDINFSKSEGGGLIAKYPGIYKLEAGRLTICLGTDHTRPSEFACKLGSKSMLLTLTRSKE